MKKSESTCSVMVYVILSKPSIKTAADQNTIYQSTSLSIMKINFIKIAAIMAMLAVIFGAFGAHSLQDKISAESIKIFETGVRYQFYHSFAILFVGLYCQIQSKQSIQYLNYAGWCFLIGIFLFSGSLYLLACREWLGIENWKFLGPLTPIGGLAFILGWAFIFFHKIDRE